MIIDEEIKYVPSSPRIETWQRINADTLGLARMPGQLLLETFTMMQAQVAAEAKQAAGVYLPIGHGYLVLRYVQPVERLDLLEHLQP